MTQRNLVRLLVAQTMLMVLLGWTTIYLGRDEFRLAVGRDEESLPAPSLLADAETGRLPEVRLSGAAQQRAGIELQLPTATTLSADASSRVIPVTVLDPQPLTELRGRLQTALHELTATRATATASRLEQVRVQALFDDDRSASQRALDAANAQAMADAARERSALSQLNALHDGARAAWGPVVASWLETADGSALQRLLSGREVMLRAVLRADDTGRAPDRLSLTPPGRSEPLMAQGLGTVAPSAADTTAGGRHLLFLAPGAGLSTGMRLTAHGAGGSSEVARSGSLVPASALIWHAGQAWIYVREAPGETEEDAGPAAKPTAAASGSAASRMDSFQRLGLPNAVRLGDQWFVPGLEADDPVVVRGAQLLLSEELKSQIKNENDD